MKPAGNPATPATPAAAELWAGSSRSSRVTLAAGLALLALSLLPIAGTVNDGTLGDIYVYERVGTAVQAGRVPYRDFSLEYPPYALPAFLAPTAIHLRGGYPTAFALEMLLLDVLVKLLLLVEGRRSFRGWLGLLPLALFSIDGWAQQFIYLKRFDLLPAALVLLAVLAYTRARPLAAGVALAFAAGVKVYPLVLFPALAAAAWRRGELKRFAAGFALGLAPLAALALAMPWWESMSLQANRALQVESLLGSLIWLLHLTAGVEAHWTWVHAWYDVTGPAGAAAVAPAKVLLVAAVVLSVGASAWSALRSPPRTASATALLLLLPLTAFIGFANVLSPQFVIWYWALLALAAPAGPPLPIVLLAAAGPLTALFYPSPRYDSSAGLELSRTVALVARNLLLVAGWAMLYSAHVLRPRSEAAHSERT